MNMLQDKTNYNPYVKVITNKLLSDLVEIFFSKLNPCVCMKSLWLPRPDLLGAPLYCGLRSTNWSYSSMYLSRSAVKSDKHLTCNHWISPFKKHNKY